MKEVATFTLCLALLACAQAPRATAPSAAAGAQSSTPAAASARAELPAPAPEPVVAAAVETPTAPAPPEAQLYLVNLLAQDLALLKTSDGAAVAASAALFSKLGDDGITLAEHATRGLPLFAEITGMAGAYPDSVWLMLYEPRDRTGVSDVYRSSKSGWTRVSVGPSDVEYVAIGNWNNGRVLAARSITTEQGEVRYGFHLLSGSKTALPAFTKPSARQRRTPDSNCSSSNALVPPDQIAILPNGHIFSLGTPCDEELKAVEHWAPGRTVSTIERVPSSESWTEAKLVAQADGSLLVLGKSDAGAILASFDAQGWRAEPLSLAGELQTIDRAPDGTLFAVTFERATRPERPRAFRRSPGQTSFSELALPPAPDGAPLDAVNTPSIVALSNDDAWLAIGQGLLHTRPAQGGPRTIDFEQEQQLPADLHSHKLASEHCRDVFVLLFPVSQAAPKDFDYPELRAALAGSSELGKLDWIEAEDNGTRYVGARAENLEQGRELAKLAGKAVIGAKPSVLCANPKVSRALALHDGIARR